MGIFALRAGPLNALLRSNAAHAKGVNCPRKFGMALRITAFYLVVFGFLGSIWPLLGIGPSYFEFDAQTLLYKISAYSKELLVSLGFFVSGIGIFLGKAWARTTGLWSLAVAAYLGGTTIAWGWAGGRPTSEVLAYSYVASIVWYGFWFYILYRDKTVQQLTRSSSKDAPCAPLS